MLRYLKYMLRIRRVEFRIAEIPILLIPLLLMLTDASFLRTSYFWEGVLIFFLLFAFGDIINCLADRDLDAVYKPHLSEAVYGLGVRFVTFQVYATALAALAFAAHLSWRLNRWQLFALVAVGLVLGAAYSVEPLRLKRRGLAQLVCLWLIIFVGPMLFVATLVGSFPTLTVLLFAAAYGTLQMGVILVNTAEDYPEDSAAGVRTTIVALGLRRGITLAFWMTLAGAVGVLALLIRLFSGRQTSSLHLLALLPAVAACIYVTGDIRRLQHAVEAQGLDEGIRTVKRAAKRVPIWITLVAWSILGAALAFFLTGGGKD